MKEMPTRIFGIGINDAAYVVQPTVNGKRVRCPFYQKWMSMMTRCYSSAYHAKRPTYIGCTVVPEWLHFSSFKKWMEQHDWKDMELDKDIIIQGNKIYSPTTCVFVTRAVNTLLNDCAASRGKYPQGVNWDKKASKFKVCCRVEGKRKYLGLFTTVEAAEAAYIEYKTSLIVKIAHEQADDRVRYGLLRIASEKLSKPDVFPLFNFGVPDA